jgi:hypothetical protein
MPFLSTNQHFKKQWLIFYQNLADSKENVYTSKAQGARRKEQGAKIKKLIANS